MSTAISKKANHCRKYAVWRRQELLVLQVMQVCCQDCVLGVSRLQLRLAVS